MFYCLRSLWIQSIFLRPSFQEEHCVDKTCDPEFRSRITVLSGDEIFVVFPRLTILPFLCVDRETTEWRFAFNESYFVETHRRFLINDSSCSDSRRERERVLDESVLLIPVTLLLFILFVSIRCSEQFC